MSHVNTDLPVLLVCDHVRTLSGGRPPVHSPHLVHDCKAQWVYNSGMRPSTECVWNRGYLWGLAAMSVSFLAVAWLMQGGCLAPLEAAVYLRLSRFITPTATAVMKAVSFVGSKYGIVGAISILLILPVTRRRFGVWLGLNAAASALLNTALKHLFARPRPDVLRLVAESGYSFPSGHSMNGAAFWLLTALILCGVIPERRTRRIIFALCLVPPFLIGLSRVYLGVHYGGDVVAGWLAGAFVALCTDEVRSRVSRRGL